MFKKIDILMIMSINFLYYKFRVKNIINFIVKIIFYVLFKNSMFYFRL